MAKKKNKTLTNPSSSELGGDRRARRRYPISLLVQYKIVKNYLVIGTGNGNSVNLSSKGIAFSSQQPLRPGSYVELSISWPVLLDQSCPLQLVASGKVVRSDRGSTAITMDRYEFRTQGSRASHAGATPQPMPIAFRQ
jgi:hypothetical protein